MDFRGSLSPPRPPPPDLATFHLGPLSPELPPDSPDTTHGTPGRPPRERRRLSSRASFSSTIGGTPVIPIERDFGDGTRSTLRADGRDGLRRRRSSGTLHSGESVRVDEESRRCESFYPCGSAVGAEVPGKFCAREPFLDGTCFCGRGRLSSLSPAPRRRGLYDDRLGRGHSA